MTLTGVESLTMMDDTWGRFLGRYATVSQQYIGHAASYIAAGRPNLAPGAATSQSGSRVLRYR